MELSIEISGPMVGGSCIGVRLDPVRDEDGRQYLVLLQYGGQVHSTCTSSSRVGEVWVKNPPLPPKTEPVITLMLAMGGPRVTFNAAGILDNARYGLGLIATPLWEGGELVKFSALVIANLAFAIERAIPEDRGEFVVRWEPIVDDGLPF